MGNVKIPTYSFNIKSDGQNKLIFDQVRKKYVVLTPEEWVRQNVIQYLISEKNYPKALIAVEKQLNLNNMKKRYDIVVFNRRGEEAVLIECKSQKVKITQDTFNQIASYNLALKVKYLVVTNGISVYSCEVDFEDKKIMYLSQIPEFETINM